MPVPHWPLALFRIAFGLLYLDMAFQKAPWIDFGWLHGFIQKEIANPTFPAMAAFFPNVVLPHFPFLGYLTFNVPGEWYWIWVLLTMPQFCFALCAAGRVRGLDALVRARLAQAAPTGWARFVLAAS